MKIEEMPISGIIISFCLVYSRISTPNGLNYPLIMDENPKPVRDTTNVLATTVPSMQKLTKYPII